MCARSKPCIAGCHWDGAGGCRHHRWPWHSAGVSGEDAQPPAGDWRGARQQQEDTQANVSQRCLQQDNPHGDNHHRNLHSHRFCVLEIFLKIVIELQLPPILDLNHLFILGICYNWFIKYISYTKKLYWNDNYKM